MYDYEIITSPVEFLSGTTSKVSPLYMEAVRTIENNSPKSMGYLKNYITSIENLASKENMKNDKVSRSKGNIQKFSGYNNIKSGLDLLTTHVHGEEIVKNLKDILKALEYNQNVYSDGYSKHIRIIMLEYESSMYMLTMGISFAIASYIDIQQSGTQVKIVKKNNNYKGVIDKTIRELAKALNTKDHSKYLDGLVKVKDNVPTSTKLEFVDFTESAVIETIDLIKSLWGGVTQVYSTGANIVKIVQKTMFGILPLIRIILYLRYKRKADTIMSLEDQIDFIEMNIDQLKNIKNIDEEKKKVIIEKQRAVIEAFRKKSEKLRAELLGSEKDASTAIKKEDPVIKQDSSDDFILD